MVIQSVAQIVEHREIPQTSPDETVRKACHVLDRLNVGALVVLEEDTLVGILSERDVIRKCICQSKRTSDTMVREIMTPNPQVVSVNSGPADALRVMVDGGFRHLPVLSRGKVVGLLSIRDVPTEYRLMLERYKEHVAPPAHV